MLNLFGVGVGAVSGAFEFHAIVEKVNSANVGWKATVPTRFGSMEDVKQVLGTWTRGHPNFKDGKKTEGITRATEDLNPLPATAIPTDFDSRTQWPKCTTIAHVRDQSACGSCWAFASTEAFSDRRCVATGEDVLFSTEDTASCCNGFVCGGSRGCQGGQPSAALQWMHLFGVVTGGDYPNRTQSSDGCKPYSLAPCAHHVPPSAKYPKCPAGDGHLFCQRKCSDTASNLTYSQDKHKGKGTTFYTTIEGMQTAIMQSGPLAVAFTVYGDFETYKSGVYRHVTGDELGGHAVEMIGWGVEKGQDYWLIKNSWNEQWGDGGFFKILKGKDECGIEDDVYGIAF